jgi:hypothetical protein
LNELGTSSSTPLSPEQVEKKKQQGQTNYYIRLPRAYAPFFQAMAEDYYQRGKIKAPTIGLLAKICLMTAGNAWNRMQIQLMNKEWEQKLHHVEQERQRQQQHPQNYQQGREFEQSSSHRDSKSELG